MRRKKATRAEVQLQLWPEISDECPQISQSNRREIERSLCPVERRCRNGSDGEEAEIAEKILGTSAKQDFASKN